MSVVSSSFYINVIVGGIVNIMITIKNLSGISGLERYVGNSITGQIKGVVEKLLLYNKDEILNSLVQCLSNSVKGPSVSFRELRYETRTLCFILSNSQMFTCLSRGPQVSLLRVHSRPPTHQTTLTVSPFLSHPL